MLSFEGQFLHSVYPQLCTAVDLLGPIPLTLTVYWPDLFGAGENFNKTQAEIMYRITRGDIKLEDSKLNKKFIKHYENRRDAELVKFKPNQQWGIEYTDFIVVEDQVELELLPYDMVFYYAGLKRYCEIEKTNVGSITLVSLETHNRQGLI